MTTPETSARVAIADRMSSFVLCEDGHRPSFVWSSKILEDAIAAILDSPPNEVGDVFGALSELLCHKKIALTHTTANFIRDVVVLCFTRYRSSYDRSDFGWMLQTVDRDTATDAQLYFASLALPRAFIAPRRDRISTRLRDTFFIDAIQSMLTDT